MVQIVGLVLALGLIEDAVSVEDEWFVGGVDGYGDGTFVDEGGLERDRVVGRDVDVAGELCADGCVVEVAVAVRL